MEKFLAYSVDGNLVLTIREQLGLDAEGVAIYGQSVKRARVKSVEHAVAWLRKTYSRVSVFDGARATGGRILASGGVK